MEAVETFGDRLSEAVARKRSCLVVGLDPLVERLPPDVYGRWSGGSSGSEAVTAKASLSFGFFLNEVIDAVSDAAVAVKPNCAFFERYGAAGWECLRQVCQHAQRAGLLVILDAKRGDIAHTARSYAEALLGDTRDTVGPHVDAVTLNPYMGTDSVEPYLPFARERGKGLFMLVRTSNPSSSELQNLVVDDGRPLYMHTAGLVAGWNRGLAGSSGLGPVGAVVGATAPAEAAAVRAALPESIFLVPGFGAQGGKAEDLRAYFLPGGRGAVVNASRSILFAYQTDAGRAYPKWTDAIHAAAVEARDALREVME